MKYISVKQTAIKWGITERRVRFLIENGRVEGAFKNGKSYLIPENSNKQKI